MTPEAAAFLAKDRHLLTRSAAMLAANWPDDAGRAAYLAGFHAAQALIFERRGRIAKTHAGVHTAFSEIARGEPDFDPELRIFLSRAYNLKTLADYETDPAASATLTRATRALAESRRFVAAVVALLGADGTHPPGA
ncbi:MAG: HEPN domain-containing protein [Acetobacteraceae bacterium]|nr:HEPN domain-containing protein [Acetobacteraceae bacterium]